MILISIRLTILMCLNYFVFYGSKYLDVYQLIDDIRSFIEIDHENESIRDFSSIYRDLSFALYKIFFLFFS
jgi:hypothetical protein